MMTPENRRQFLRATTAAATLATVPRSNSTAAEPAAPTAKRSPIKIGQIGVGHAHASKLSVYLRSPDYEVVGIAEPTPALREQAKNRPPYRDVPWMTVQQLLDTPGLQAVLVETQVRDLLDTAELCIAAGKHIHLDKPAGESLPQFRKILQEAGRQDLLVQMGYMYRYNPAVILLRDFLRKGWLGDVFEVHTVMSKVVPPASRARLDDYAGGMMLELGCHILDLVIGILGKPDQVTPFVQHASTIQDELADNMLAVLNYPRALASVKSSAMEVEGFARRHLVVCGTKGTFHIQPLDNPSARIALDQDRETYRRGYQDVSFPKFVRYVDDAADMAKIIRGEKTTDYPYEHDLAVQETLLQAARE